jgi:hypothetical protein
MIRLGSIVDRSSVMISAYERACASLEVESVVCERGTGSRTEFVVVSQDVFEDVVPVYPSDQFRRGERSDLFRLFHQLLQQVTILQVWACGSYTDQSVRRKR